MKNLLKFARSIRKNVLLTGAAISLLTGGALLFGGSIANAATASSSTTQNCDANAVMWCGATKASGVINKYRNGDDHNTAASIQHIYNYKTFNITSTDISDMANATINGSVTKTGDVYVGSKLVAKDAITAGREDITGSTKEVVDGTTFYVRTPSVSFLNNSLPAFVVLNSKGQFEYAIIESCGNPVAATNVVPTPAPTPTPKPTPTPTPTPKPAYAINKEVAVAGSSTFSKNLSTKSGTEVEYKITVDSTGNAPVTNLDVSDKLPADITYVANSLKLNSANETVGDFFGKGITIASLANGSTDTFTFDATAGVAATDATCKAEALDNVGTMTATSLPTTTSTATVGLICTPPPVYACTSLTDTQVSRTVFDFTVSGAAKNGAVIEGYTINLGNGVTKTVSTKAASYTLPYTYTAAGTNTVIASVNVDVNGKAVTETSPACSVPVTVKPAPLAECTDLTLDQNATNPLIVTATANDSLENGATLTGVSFNWGDSTAAESNGTNLAATHTYATESTYNVIATLTFSPSTVATSTCQAPITITVTPPTCNELTPLTIDNDSKSVTANGVTYSANDATYAYTTLDWGDNSGVVSASDITGQTHAYSGEGPYNVIATTYFTENGSTMPITSDSCEQTVSFTTPVTPTTPITPTTPTTPTGSVTASATTPTSLVNTGAGNVFGMFAVAVAAGTIGYRYFLRRKLSQ
jgi:uncharacterized repeat protein (TIGR01451 family)